MAKSRLKTSPADSSGSTATLDRDRVAMRAYEIYLARGGAAGQELDDWLSAERELSGDREPQEDTSGDEN